jgi:hypothetical protein
MLLGLQKLLEAAKAPLTNIAELHDDSSAYAGLKSLAAYDVLLDVCAVFYQSLEPQLEPLDPKPADDFVYAYNQAVYQYRAALNNVDTILSHCTVVCHHH